ADGAGGQGDRLAGRARGVPVHDQLDQAAEEAGRRVTGMKIVVTDQAGEVHELEGLDGWRAMEVIRDWGLNIKAECGGACSCATCHVWVDEAWYGKLPKASDDEEDLI